LHLSSSLMSCWGASEPSAAAPALNESKEEPATPPPTRSGEPTKCFPCIRRSSDEAAQKMSKDKAPLKWALQETGSPGENSDTDVETEALRHTLGRFEAAWAVALEAFEEYRGPILFIRDVPDKFLDFLPTRKRTYWARREVDGEVLWDGTFMGDVTAGHEAMCHSFRMNSVLNFMRANPTEVLFAATPAKERQHYKWAAESGRRAVRNYENMVWSRQEDGSYAKVKVKQNNVVVDVRLALLFFGEFFRSPVYFEPERAHRELDELIYHLLTLMREHPDVGCANGCKALPRHGGATELGKPFGFLDVQIARNFTKPST